MFKKTDPNTYTKFCYLLNKETVIGSIAIEYQITLYEEVRSKDAASVYKARDQLFIVNCTQRINIYNPNSQNLQPTHNLTAYNNYPAMINTSMYLNQYEGMASQLLKYSPETINTQVESSGTTGTDTGLTKESASSTTSGSTTSQTNTYGTSVNISDTSMGASATYEHSSTVSRENSNTNSSSLAVNNSTNAANSASMSIKDWGAYALVNPTTKKPSWTFGQEYPWDAIQCKNTDGVANPNNPEQVRLVIPTSMLVRLYDQVTLYPPSELSRFGINFVMNASWIVEVSHDASTEITIDHVVNYFSASHILAGSTVSVYIDQNEHILSAPGDESLSTSVDLNFMALAPLGLRSDAAIIGFIPNKFIKRPAPASAASAPVAFKIISTTNDLMILDTTKYPADCNAGAGFTASQTSLTADFSANCIALQMTMYFKVIDSVTNYILYIKHWKAKATGVMLTLVINNDLDNPIVKYVDATEAEGGENNLLQIALRNQDFASIDYHDYLQLGLNAIQITMQPFDNNYADCAYQVRAISIEQG
ncbi:MAG: hypothetical protein PHW13_10590 [Methylococcales bacterium]|nr:hypothetical protein [Methylococcales bacterium]